MTSSSRDKHYFKISEFQFLKNFDVTLAFNTKHLSVSEIKDAKEFGFHTNDDFDWFNDVTPMYEFIKNEIDLVITVPSFTGELCCAMGLSTIFISEFPEVVVRYKKVGQEYIDRKYSNSILALNLNSVKRNLE